MEIQLHGATAHPRPAPSEEVVRELLMGTTRPAAQESTTAADSRVQQKGHMGHAKCRGSVDEAPAWMGLKAECEQMKTKGLEVLDDSHLTKWMFKKPRPLGVIAQPAWGIVRILAPPVRETQISSLGPKRFS
ncbi:hypothetical protein DFH08DRAFT_814998 [Mycena albidolilacea]|uniref:Uncharacterized protein n=1 Tax=Mycena albidolilacea TaxID=1033008 RepID=A0AAD6ZN95_9AGAR|nr:hypothetical protein DFH08DRAFT_814998 [Mycena albidolilacea]